MVLLVKWTRDILAVKLWVILILFVVYYTIKNPICVLAIYYERE